MKYILLRAFKSMVPLLVCVITIVTIISYSIKLYREGYNQTERWFRFSVEDYDNPNNPSIDEQIESMERTYLESGSDEKLLNLNILKLLQKRGLRYSQVAEGGYYVGDSKTKPYFDYMMSKRIYLINIIVIVLIVGIVCVSGRANGAFSFDILIWGRRKIFLDELSCCFVMITGLCAVEMILIWACRSCFSSYSQYFVYNLDHKVFLMSVDVEGFLTYLSYYLRLLAMFAVYFSIAQIILYTIPYYTISAGAAYLLVFMNHNEYDTTFKLICNENIGTFYLFQGNYFQFWAIKIGIAIVVAALIIVAYMVQMNRNLRTEY